jgi:hypothetical protein
MIHVINFISLGVPRRGPVKDFAVASDAVSLELHTRLWRSARRFVSATGGEIPSIG